MFLADTWSDYKVLDTDRRFPKGDRKALWSRPQA